MLDDHDLIDGFGTYPDKLMTSPVFNAIGGQFKDLSSTCGSTQMGQ